jgi:hypothetical protein
MFFTLRYNRSKIENETGHSARCIPMWWSNRSKLIGVISRVLPSSYLNKKIRLSNEPGVARRVCVTEFKFKTNHTSLQ